MVALPRFEPAVLFALKVAARAGQVMIGWVWPWAVVLAIVLGLGLVAAAVRVVIIDTSPWVVHHSKLVAGIWNVWGKYLSFALKEAQDFIIGIQNVIIAIEDLAGRHTSFKAFKDPTKFTEVSAAQITRIFNRIPVECNGYEGPWRILKGSLIKLHGHDVCRVLRSFEPTPADAILQPAIGWLADGGYAPTPGANCDEAGDGMPWFCVPFGTGFIILEFVFPLGVLVLAAAAVWIAAGQIRAETKAATASGQASQNTKDIEMLTINAKETQEHVKELEQSNIQETAIAGKFSDKITAAPWAARRAFTRR